MVEFKWIQISLFLTAVLQFTAADKQSSSFTVRVGDDVTLPCENVIDSQEQCDGTIWLFSDSTNKPAVELIKRGQINEEAKSKSDRLSVTEKCSLVIKKVTVEDVGLYSCQQYDKPGGKQVAPESHVYLSVVTMTEQKDTDEVTLTCSVRTYDGRCRHTVKWLFNNTEFDENNQEVMTSQSSCSASVNLLTSHHIYTSRFNFLKCEVTDVYNEQKFLFSIRPSGDDTKTTTESPINDATTENSSKRGTNTQTSVANEDTAKQRACTGHSALDYIMLVMRVVELLLITVITVLLIRARGNQRPPDDNTVLNSVRRSGPAASQVNHDEDEADGVVKYENFGEASSVRLR